MITKKIIQAAILLSISMNSYASSFAASAEIENNTLDDYSLSPLSSVLSKEQYENFDSLMDESPQEKSVLEGRVITLNTKDQEGCNEAREQFNLEKEVCTLDEKNPFVSVVVMRPVEDRNYFEKKINFSGMSEKEKIALKSLRDFSVLGVATIGLIYSLPESVSKWDKSKGFTSLAGRYSDRVHSGPVVDQDDWYINYIGHPLSGAFYYTVVRHQGFSALESAAFSFAMSTFFWEYGLEAFAEIPSIQDLILTPLIGSIIGEAFYSWGNAIENNGGKLLGSQRLGKTARVLMNPAASIGNQINKLFKANVIKKTELSIVNKSPMQDNAGPKDLDLDASKNYVGLQLKFKF